MALMQASELRDFSKLVVPKIAKSGEAAFQYLSRSLRPSCALRIH